MTEMKTSEKQKPAVEKGMKLGTHQFPKFDGVSMAFGARSSDYPSRETIPVQFYNGRTPFNHAVSGLFFKGGKLADYGLSLKPGIGANEAMRTVKALLSSFDAEHEIKEATVAWAFSEWCDYTPPKSAA